MSCYENAEWRWDHRGYEVPKEALYPKEIEPQVREGRNRNLGFPITFVENAEQQRVDEH